MTTRIRNSRPKHKRRSKKKTGKRKTPVISKAGFKRKRMRQYRAINRSILSQLPNPNDPREKALELMKKGISQAQAAKTYGISSHRVARYRKQYTKSKMRGGKWIIIDRRPAEMWIASNGRIYAIAVRYRNRSMVGEYWNAVNQFLITNDPSHLKPFQDKGIRDAQGKYHPWETGPNTLRKLDGIGELNFVEIYSQTAQ